jgi:hypothetical protein
MTPVPGHQARNAKTVMDLCESPEQGPPMWDSRWTDAEQNEAIAGADRQILVARLAIDEAMREVDRRITAYSRAIEDALTVREFRAAASAPMDAATSSRKRAS